ncbi:MAG TPA: N-acetyltransferase [Gaiellaceae bacterium]|nr:N-acetyltransferase [Gaiellaceae bacterium]
MRVRPEREDDFAQIDAVVRAAFEESGDAVALLVRRTRADGNAVPEGSLVALDGSAVIGYLQLSWVGLEGGSRDRILDLGPLGVRPDRQGRGVGRALVEAQIAVVERLGEPMLMVEGIPSLYPRFGFERGDSLGFTKPHDSIPDAAFMVRRFAGYTPDLAGRVRYPAAFDHLPY